MSPSGEAATRSAAREFPSVLRNPRVHNRVHKNLPAVSIVKSEAQEYSRINTILNFELYFLTQHVKRFRKHLS
jgi:hypothetical protein